METSSEKKNQKTKVRTHSGDEKKMTGLYRWKTKDLHGDKWRHLKRKKDNKHIFDIKKIVE